MNELKITGGAKVGCVSASWPFAKLSINDKELGLNVSMIGRYKFGSEQVVSIEKYVMIPFLAWGLKINHNVESYPKQIVFYSFTQPKKLLEKISETGFNSEGSYSASTTNKPSSTGMPVKILPVILAVLFLNILTFINFETPEQADKLGLEALIPLFFILFTSIGIKMNSTIASIFVKPDRSVDEIKPMLNLIILVTGILSVTFSFALILGL